MTRDSDRENGLADWTERPGASVDAAQLPFIYSRYTRAAEVLAGKQALEIGCGTGFGSLYLKSFARKLIALEYSRSNIEAIPASLRVEVPVLRADAARLPIRSGSSDAVAALAMVYYIDLPAFFVECRRVLKPGGTLFFDSTNPDFPGFVPPPWTQRYYGIREMGKLLKDSGFIAEANGVFPAEKPFDSRKRAAQFKERAKSIVNALPAGDKIWALLRRGLIERPQSMPPYMCAELECRPAQTPLPLDRDDDNHPVYWISARSR